jgi:hypothetical protein
MPLEQCAFCGLEFEAAPDNFAGSATGEPICPRCKGVEALAEEVKS